MHACKIPLVVVTGLIVFALVGLVGSIWLVANKAEGTSIAIISGLCGTALGSVAGILSRTESRATGQDGESQKVEVTNTSENKVPVKEGE